MFRVHALRVKILEPSDVFASMSFYDQLIMCLGANLRRRVRGPLDRSTERDKSKEQKMKTSIDKQVFFQLASIKSARVLQSWFLSRLPVPSILTEDHGFVREAILFFFFSFLSSLHLRFSRTGSFSSRPTASTVFAESSRSIINDIRVTQAREILNTVALLRRLRWEREA